MDLDGGVQIRCDTGIFETPKDIDDFTNCPLIDQISVLVGVVVPMVDVGWQKKCPPIVKVGLSRFQIRQENRQACITDSTQDIWKTRTIWLR